MKRPRLAAVLFWGYAVVWTTLLLVPDPARIFFLPAGAPEQLARSPVPVDKVAHASGYFLLMLFAAAAFHRRSAGVGIAWLLAVGAGHGAITELAQWAIPPREGDWADFLMDVVGLGVGAWVWSLFRRTAPSRGGTEQEVQPGALE